MHLDPDAVEFGVDDRGCPGGEQRRADVGGALREHRGQRGADPQMDLRERGRATGQGRDGDLLQITGEQQRPAYGGDRHLRGHRDRLGQQPGLRTLPQLPAEQPDQQPLLVRGRRPEQRAEQLPPPRLRPGPGHRGDLGDRRVDPGDGQRRLGGRRRTGP